MKKPVFWTVTAALAAGSVFGYGDTDKDPSGHQYCDTNYYVQCQGYAGGGGNWEMGYLYDKGGLWYKGGNYSFATNTTFWSTGVGPNQFPDMDYYINGNMQLYVAASSAYAQAPTNQTFQGHSLTIGAFGAMRVDGNKYAKTSYSIKFPHFYIRPCAKIYAWAALPFSFAPGEFTVLSTDADHPSTVIGGWNGQGYYFKNNLIGAANAQLHLQGALEPGKHDIGADISFMEFSGDNSGYLGNINVGLNLKVRLGNGGFPKATIDISGKSVKYFNTYPYTVTNVAYTALGVCEAAGTKPQIGQLIVADGVTFECAGMVTNNNGFYVSKFTQKGKIKLDFGGTFLAKKLEILEVAANDSTSTALDTANFTLVNQLNPACTLKVETDATTGNQILSIVPDDDYVYLTAQDTMNWNNPWDPNTLSYYGTGHWSDGLAPHADADYLVSGENHYLYVPIWYTAGRDGTGRKSGYADFYGRSLTLVEGGSFRPASYKYAVAAADFQMYIKDLRLAPGGYIRSNDGNNAVIFSAKGKVTVSGTSARPAFIASGTNNNSADNVSRLFFFGALTGSGVVVLTGGYTTETLPAPHWMEFNGDNSGFTGTMRVEPATSAQVSMATRANLSVHFGASGLPNGSLVMNNYEPHLGVSKSASGKLVPIKNLTLAAGNTLDVGTMMTNNNMRGFLVTGSYQQTGVVTVDVANVSLSARAINVLRVAPGAGTLDLSKFVLVNDPDANAKLALSTTEDYQTLQIVDDAVQTTIQIDNNTRIKLIAAVEPGDVPNPEDYVIANTTKAETDTDWYRIYTSGNACYVENYKCCITNGYDVSLCISDYHCTNEVTKLQNESFLQGQNWTDKQAPHTGAAYIARGQLMFLTSRGAQTFGGDSLTVCGIGTGNSWLRDDNQIGDITVNDLRLLDGAVLQSSGATNYCLKGQLRVLSSQYPAWLCFANTMARIHIASKLIGGSTRILGTKIDGTDAGASCLRVVYLDGDTSEFEGTLVMTNTFMLAVGPMGLVNGTAQMATATSGITSYDTAAPAEVKTLKLANGATIQAKTSVYGLQVTNLELAGTVALDFGTTPIARSISVLTVPASTALSTDSFRVTSPVEGYVLKIEETDGYKTLAYVYEKTVTVGGLSATVNADYSCTISGEGELSSAASVLREEGIKELTLGEGVTGVASGALSKFYALTKVTFKNTGKVTVADNAFLRCNSLESIAFEGEVPDLSEKAFTLQSAIYMKGGIPTIESIPAVTVQGYTRVIKASNDLTNWTTITAGTTDYHFFKVVYEKQ